MGLFGKLFEKKECSVCGGEIGLLGNRKLEDGNLCKNCAAKLSPWFSDRRQSTVAEIQEQLAYREANQEKVAAFHTTRSAAAHIAEYQFRKVHNANSPTDVPCVFKRYSAVFNAVFDIDASRCAHCIVAAGQFAVSFSVICRIFAAERNRGTGSTP